MRPSLRLALVAALATPVLAHANPPRAPGPWRAEMAPFRTEAALRAWLRRARPRVISRGIFAALGAPGGATGSGIVSPFGGLTESGPATPVGAGGSVTNNQVEGVDEGDIVKARGDFLVVLRRGRLFTVDLRGGAMRPSAALAVTPPGGRPADWYDEMLVDGDTVVVLGYDYADDGGAGTTQILRFGLSPGGALSFRDARYLRSGDYYAGRNYATRLVGHKLIVYMPAPLLDEGAATPRVLIPSILVGRGAGWASVMDWARVYRPFGPTPAEPTLHAVLTCDFDAPGDGCRAVGVAADAGRSFYVSGTAVYLRVDPARAEGARAAPSVVYRFPLDGGDAGAVAVRGATPDQFSFHERDGSLHLCLRATAAGDAMWGPEVTAGDVAAASVPLAQFGRAVSELDVRAYTRLPAPAGGGEFHNRFVGDRLLYGVGAWSPDASALAGTLYVHRLGGAGADALPLGHAVDRIEPLGRDALAVGRGRDGLHLTPVALDARPSLGAAHVLARAGEAESRSHGFFYLPRGDRRGMLGLPVHTPTEVGWGLAPAPGDAGVSFFEVEGGALRALGEVAARREPEPEVCVASCADWYGNTRPIFYAGRVFALLGYELVEAALDGGRVTERARAWLPDVAH